MDASKRVIHLVFPNIPQDEIASSCELKTPEEHYSTTPLPTFFLSIKTELSPCRWSKVLKQSAVGIFEL
jgi:hypothetical protein